MKFMNVNAKNAGNVLWEVAKNNYIMQTEISNIYVSKLRQIDKWLNFLLKQILFNKWN